MIILAVLIMVKKFWWVGSLGGICILNLILFFLRKLCYCSFCLRVLAILGFFNFVMSIFSFGCGLGLGIRLKLMVFGIKNIGLLIL